jgi:hypothetical protein
MSGYVTSAEAGRILNLTAASVRLMARSGRLVPVIRTASGVQLFDSDEVRELAERRAAVIAAATAAHPVP